MHFKFNLQRIQFTKTLIYKFLIIYSVDSLFAHYFHSMLKIDKVDYEDDCLLHKWYFYNRYVYATEFGWNSYIVPTRTVYTRYMRVTRTEYDFSTLLHV